MLGIMLQKILAKKWMFLCLLLGSTLLIATVVSFPLYQNAAFDRMLQDEFRRSYAETGEWPAKLSKILISQKDDKENLIEITERQMEELYRQIGLQTEETAAFYQLTQWGLHSTMGRSDMNGGNLRLASMTNLEEHVTLLAGDMFSDDGMTEDGCIEVLISQSCMVGVNLLLGETLEFNSLADEEGNLLRLKIIGVFREDQEDLYWEIGTDGLKYVCLMQDDLFRDMFVNGWMGHNITCRYCSLLAYGNMRASQADMLLEALEEGSYRADTCQIILEDFTQNRLRVSVTLFVLQVPVLVLLAAFLFMVSGQMYELERNEISVIKSRGSSGIQIFKLYLYQSVFLAIVGVLLGVPLGVLFCKILGSASNFLEFGLRRNLNVYFTLRSWLYLAAAALATVVIMAFPAIRHSRISIVNLKQSRVVRKKSWWERCFLDFICLGIGLYGYYNYSANQSTLLQNVLTGRSVDPLLYICSSLFIVGAGLLFLRVQPLLVRLIYMAGEKRFRPAAHASFLEILKNGRKQHFIMLFLILTIALGVFYATVARTVLQNALENMEYLDAVDIIVKETWSDNSLYAAYMEEDTGVQADIFYNEPDFQKYSTLDAAQSYTKVLYAVPYSNREKVRSYCSVQGKTVEITLMGISTKEFGEKTWVDRELLGKHYYEYLNLLADTPNGILVSSSFRDELGYKEGQYINYHYDTTIGSGDNVRTYQFSILGRILGFVDYWPGFQPDNIYLNSAGEAAVQKNYLIVANISALQSAFGANIQPYEVWISLKEDADSAEVAEWINEKNLKIEKYVDRQGDMQDTIEAPLLQGTNGVLTMGFLVMILLCGTGYLIYWVMSIRSREMLFGVLRALGMHKRELFQMLFLEQLFTGILSIPVGIVIGKLASAMYVPMLQTAYAAARQALPMQLYTNPEDMLRLYMALALVLVVCFGALIGIVFKLNVTKALKLGEE